MEELTSLIRKNGETLDCNDWNKLVIAINTIISFYNAYPTKLSEFENDLEFVSYNRVITIVLELIQSGIIPSTEGLDGKSAYLIAVDNGFSGTELLWLASLQGEVGKSAYLLAVLNGFTGTTLLWLLSLKGLNGLDGQNGLNGKSAFELAVEEGFDGTLQQWLDSLKGEDGTPGQDGYNGVNGTNGKSAYELAIEQGYEGTLELWLESLHGLDGTNGLNGQNGLNGITPHIDPTTGNWFIGETNTGVHAQGPAGQNGSAANQLLADWNQTDNTQVDYIKNKPAIINGTDGITPHIDSTSKHWMIGETDTGVVAEGLNGLNGTNGTNGTDGVTPHIDSTTGNWFIGNTDTGVHALGPAGQGGSGSGVLSDWNETDNTSLAYIANKPTIPTVPSNETAASGGSTLSVVTTGDKYNWNNKASIWSGTQAQYDALSPNYDSNTIYIITAAS